jgi:two-component system, NtrC family, sensor histidine kinase PilS
MSTRPADSLPPERTPEAYTWQPLRAFAVYRLLIVGSLTLVALISGGSTFLATVDAGLFLQLSLLYLGASVLALVLTGVRWPGFHWQLYSQLTLDIVAITALIYASGSLGSGLGVLMLVAVAAGSILASTRMAFFFAAMASLLLLTQHTHAYVFAAAGPDGYTQVGLLGISIFATALAGNLVSRRARENQELADRRGVDIANLEALNHHIVQRLHDGVLALDEDDHIRLGNQAAWALLGDAARGARLEEVAPQLSKALQRWRRHGEQTPETLLQNEQGAYRPRFQALDEERRRALVFLQDVAELRAQVQQEKLAVLGRLTAGIAHEIRNPLSAMMHAGQLLDEAQDLQPGDRRLLEIIRKQGGRLNRVVDNVLQLSRRAGAEPQPIALRAWLQEFAQDFRLQHPGRSFTLSVHVQPHELAALFDHDHLQQVLDNLCGNALRHGGSGGHRHIRLQAQANEHGQVELEVSDDGRGIDAASAARLFEPFFTTASTGTGLGLYLCRELCEANHAQLQHVPQESGSRFRIRCSAAHREIA